MFLELHTRFQQTLVIFGYAKFCDIFTIMCLI